VIGRTRSGVKQIFERIDLDIGVGKGVSGEAAADELDLRLDWFVKKVCYPDMFEAQS
jgi:hypothetical protein